MGNLTATRSAPAVRRMTRGSWIALGVAGLLVGGCVVAGVLLTRAGVSLHEGNVFVVHARWAPRFGLGLLLSIAVAGLAVAYGPWLAVTLSWRRLLGVAYAAAVVWPVSLALSDGLSGLTRPLSNRHEYLHDVPRVHSPADLLARFPEHIVDLPRWTTHVGGHPPGGFAIFVGLDRIGLAGPLWAAVLCVAAGAAVAPLVLSAVRVLGDETYARRAAPYVVFAPAALWVASSADALFAGVAAAGICALAHAATRRDRVGDLLSAAGGLALGACLFLSYGLALLAPIAAAVVLVRRRTRPLVIAAVVVVALVAAVAVAGFAWWHGLGLTAERVRIGNAWRDRPAAYFWFGNLAAVSIVVGPAVIAALPLMRLRLPFPPLPLRLGLRSLVPLGRIADSGTEVDAGQSRTRESEFVVWTGAAALGVIGLAIASNLSNGEVERIYLPFAVWLLPLAGLLPWRDARIWLAAQTGVAVLVEALLTTRW
jgi:hypothetical protein